MDLIVLIVSVALAALAFTAASALKHEHAAIRAAVSSARSREVGHYELAYLAEGPSRAADTAIALLADVGDLRVSRGGHVHQVRSGVVSRDPLEEAVLGVVASRSGLPVLALRIETTRTLAMAALQRRLTDLGLVHSDDTYARAGRLNGALKALSLTAFLGLAVPVVVMLILNTILLPALALAVLAATVVGTQIAIGRHRRALRRTLTPSGHATLDVARQENPRGTAEGPVAIALYGLGELRNPDLQVELASGVGPAHRGRGSAYVGGAAVASCGGGGGSGRSGDGSDGGSSGDGGGSGCGGGGCGGCGGCGS